MTCHARSLMAPIARLGPSTAHGSYTVHRSIGSAKLTYVWLLTLMKYLRPKANVNVDSVMSVYSRNSTLLTCRNQISLTYFTGQNRSPKKWACIGVFKPAEPHSHGMLVYELCAWANSPVLNPSVLLHLFISVYRQVTVIESFDCLLRPGYSMLIKVFTVYSQVYRYKQVGLQHSGLVHCCV